MVVRLKKLSLVSLLTIVLLVVIIYVTKAQMSPLTILVTTDRAEYFEKELIVISIIAKNESSQPITLKFNSGYQVDYIIDSSYRWSKDKGFIQMLTEVVLPPFGTKTWKLTHDSKNIPLSIGNHMIRGEIINYGSKETFISVVPVPKFIIGIHPLNGNSNLQFVSAMTDRPSINKARECLTYSQKHPSDPRCGWHIGGKIGVGNGGFNLRGNGSSWSWHLIPDTVRMVETSIELCDGVPNDVESAVPVTSFGDGSFCPWNSYIISEKTNVFMPSTPSAPTTQSFMFKQVSPSVRTIIGTPPETMMERIKPKALRGLLQRLRFKRLKTN